MIPIRHGSWQATRDGSWQAGRIRVTKGRLPEQPGVYLMYNAKGALLYVGKAANLRRRVTSYFSRANDARIERLVAEIRRIDYRETDTAIEALMLEAELIKKYRPPYNVKEKDDKSFLFVGITKEEFPRVLLVRGKEVDAARYRAKFGPFTSASNIREALRILRRIFPWSEHESGWRQVTSDKQQAARTTRKPCFDYEVGLCPGVCAGLTTKTAYAKTIARLTAIFRGRKKDVIRSLERDMRAASRAMRFEEAQMLRRKLFALTHIQDVALIGENKHFEPFASANISAEGRVSIPEQPFRIEGYDISNISGKDAVGSMVVFEDGEPKREDYRKFRIKGVSGPDDFAMLEEVLTRRANHLSQVGVRSGLGRKEIWPRPDLILVDGGAGQLTAAKKALKAAGVSGIRILGMVKGPDRKRTDIIGIVPAGVARETLVRVRDEAHRFAIGYHRKLRGRNFLGS